MSRFLIVEKAFILTTGQMKSTTEILNSKPIIDRMYIENWVLVQPAQMLEKKYKEKYSDLYFETQSLSESLSFHSNRNKQRHFFISVQITPLQDHRAIGSILDNQSLINEIESHFETKQKEKTVRSARNPIRR